jgi:hypothetical protein
VKIAMEIRKEIRIRDRLRKKYIKNKIGTNERKYKNQRNKVNNLKKSAKENFYVSINESLSELKNTNCVPLIFIFTFICAYFIFNILFPKTILDSYFLSNLRWHSYLFVRSYSNTVSGKLLCEYK